MTPEPLRKWLSTPPPDGTLGEKWGKMTMFFYAIRRLQILPRAHTTTKGGREYRTDFEIDWYNSGIERENAEKAGWRDVGIRRGHNGS
jgi:hypothetical protein